MKKVKICGLYRPEDIAAANRYEPDFCGFIINFPKSHRSLPPERVCELRAGLRDSITPVGVFVNQPPDFVAELLNRDIISVAQLHGSEDIEYISALRAATDRPIWQAFQIRSPYDVKQAANSAADFILLDAGQGAGRVFDWSLLSNCPRPFGLAGGLSLDNLSEALNTAAVLLDVSGGIETNRIKDPEKIKLFIESVRK